MQTKILTCPAKINLFLEITGRREDGYHTLDSIMHTVSLSDKLTLSVEKGEGNIIILPSGDENVPCDRRNIAYRAAEKYLSTFDINNYDVTISIDKKNPVFAGLGGGSADGAGVFRALEEIFAVGDSKKLGETALSVGADVPFCMRGGCARAEGVGEILTDVKELSSDIYFVIAKGADGVSTKEAYEKIDSLAQYTPENSEKIIKSLENGGKDFEKNLFNRFEEIVFTERPEVEKIKEDMLLLGSYGALMSGSGSALFGLFDSEKDAFAAAEKLRSRGVWATVCRPFSRDDF